MSISKKQTTYFPARRWLGPWKSQSATSNGSKTAFEVLENLPVLKTGHSLGKSWWIFDFLDNFPHYSSSWRSFVSLKWTPEGLKLLYSIYRHRDLSEPVGTHPYMVPRWIWPQTLSFFSRIILRYSKLNSSDPINIQFSKFLFLHFGPKLSCLFTFFKNFCPWHNLHVFSNILCLLWLFSTFLSFAPEPLKVWKFKNSEKWPFWGTRAYLSNGAE